MDQTRDSLRFHVLDVGHGDSIVIELPQSGRYAVVDCNHGVRVRRRRGDSPKAWHLLSTLIQGCHDQKIHPVIEFVCLSHAHRDHYSGFGELIRQLLNYDIPIQRWWDSGAGPEMAERLSRLARNEPTLQDDKDEFQSYVEQQTRWSQLTGRHPETVIARGHDCPQEIAGALVTWLAPTDRIQRDYQNALYAAKGRRNPDPWPRRSDVDPNLASSALLLTYGAGSAILGGDVTNSGWAEALREHGPPWQCHALKVSHHGSRDGNFPARAPLWQSFSSAKRQTALISGGYRPQLPHPIVLKSLDAFDIDVHMTGRGESQLQTYRANGPPHYWELEYHPHWPREVVESVESGCGDIAVDLFRDGSYLVQCEHHI